MSVKQTALVYRLMADNKKLASDLNKAKSKLSRFQAKSKGISNQIKGNLALAFSVGSVVAFGKALARTTDDYDKQAKAIAQVEQAIISTGGVANKSLIELQKTAENLQKNTLFGDEEILTGATAQLLTFTNIANENFDRVQRSVLDVSTRLDQDLKSTAIQLGKALNDPVANLGALGRSGIQFSKEQKAVIKSLADTNRLAEAQAMILEELESQYGGSAEAAAKAGLGGWTQLTNTFGDLREEIGELIAENSVSKGLSAWFKDITEGAIGVTRALNSQLSGWDKFKMLAAKAIAATTGNVSAYGEAMEAVGNAMKDQEENVRSEEAAQKAAVVQRQKQINAIREQITALKELTSTKISNNLSTVGVSSPLLSRNELGLGLSNMATLDHSYFESVKEAFKKDKEDLKLFMENEAMEIQGIIDSTLNEAFVAAFDAIGSGLGVKEVFGRILGVIGNGMQQLGVAVLGIGSALEAVKKSLLSLNGVAAIAAGGALIAAGAALKSAAGSFAGSIGGGGGSGGGASGSFRNNLSGQTIKLEGQIIASGKDLKVIFDEQTRLENRFG